MNDDDSLYYSAPEIVEEKKYVGPAVDVWSMGGILYSLVNGRLPWSGKTDLEKIRQIVVADIAPYDRDVSAACIALCKGCLTVDPKLRYTVPQLRLDPWTNIGYDAPPPCLVPHTSPIDKVSDDVIEQVPHARVTLDDAHTHTHNTNTNTNTTHHKNTPVTFSVPSSASKRFDGLRSRCTTRNA